MSKLFNTDRVPASLDIEIPTIRLSPFVYHLAGRKFIGVAPEYSYALSLFAKGNPNDPWQVT